MQILALMSLILMPQAKGGAGVSFDDKVLATIPEGVAVTEVAFSPDGRQVAYKAFKNGKFWVTVNSTKGPEYIGLESLKWSSSGKLAYRASNGGTWMVVVGNQPGPPLQTVGVPIWSPDGGKLAYEASRGQGGARDVTAWTVYVGGQKSGDYASVGTPAFSADGSIVAYNVRIGKPGTATRPFYTVHAMVIGGKVGPEVEECFHPVFAPKGNRLAYKQRDGLNWTMVVDGKAQETFFQLGTPTWNHDGTRLAYTAVQGNNKWYMVVDGKKSEEFSMVGEPVWSPDGKHFAYSVTKGEEAFIMLDGKPLEPMSGVDVPAFSPDNTMLAYGAWKAPIAKRFMVMGDRRFDASYDSVGVPVWCPDGKKVAYSALWKFKQIVAVNDGKSEMLDELGKEGPVWSPDGKQFAVSAKKDQKWWMIVGYRREEPFDEVLTVPHWSGDGKKCAYGGRKDNQLIWRVYKVPDDQ